MFAAAAPPTVPTLAAPLALVDAHPVALLAGVLVGPPRPVVLVGLVAAALTQAALAAIPVELARPLRPPAGVPGAVLLALLLSALSLLAPVDLSSPALLRVLLAGPSPALVLPAAPLLAVSPAFAARLLASPVPAPADLGRLLPGLLAPLLAVLAPAGASLLPLATLSTHLALLPGLPSPLSSPAVPSSGLLAGSFPLPVLRPSPVRVRVAHGFGTGPDGPFGLAGRAQCAHRTGAAMLNRRHRSPDCTVGRRPGP